MSKLALELGMSDVGLAKLCKRHAIATPGVGYWAKVAAGQEPSRHKLSAGEDIQIPMPSSTTGSMATRKREYGKAVAAARKRAAEQTSMPVAEMRDSLEGAHPIVRKTQRWFEAAAKAVERARKERAEYDRRVARGVREPFWGQAQRAVPQMWFGRYRSMAEGGMRIEATPSRLDWILRFHDALIRALTSSGCKVRSVEERGGWWLQAIEKNEAVTLGFAEDYEKAAAGGFSAAETFRLKLLHAETVFRHWRGTPTELERDLPEIVRAILVTIRSQEDQRALAADLARTEQAERDAVEARRKARYDADRATYLRNQARKVQGARALLTGGAQLQFEATLRALNEIESRISATPADDGLRAWLKVARSSLVAPVNLLFAELRAELSEEQRPDWWPFIEGENHAS